MAELRRPMGSLEADVLRCLWGSDTALTPAEVCEGLDTELAYTTIMTILTRLWEKGLVERKRSGRAYAYRPTLTESEHAAQRMTAVLDATDDREAALTTFIGSLSKREARLLRRLVGSPRS